LQHTHKCTRLVTLRYRNDARIPTAKKAKAAKAPRSPEKRAPNATNNPKPMRNTMACMVSLTSKSLLILSNGRLQSGTLYSVSAKKAAAPTAKADVQMIDIGNCMKTHPKTPIASKNESIGTSKIEHIR
jgi:hypothetical protein